ncbi:MFS transporter [Paenibacillus eucommiae]|uniref:DHA2 family metal-tetracycline-proton antiporter-like MFS transporter n=1 Tax=Paenibacillus eucommiae TaxID=1355755 RepID=A0ABS4IUG6_9BACL|nr:MFS transporter [Paenibacillus eucommiae]MBP1991236.1 DHA2 family metal-tetracycline-proton antiporter-like MFS transporter [Paenibacillus eucommiae]
MESSAPHSQGHADKLIKILAFTLVFSVMNASIFNVVLPVISLEFTLTPSQVSWILSSYMIVYAIGSVIYGKLADKYKLKNLLTFGLILFAAGSIVGLFATHFWMVILGRVVQAVGSSVIPATAMIIPVRYFPPHTRGRALGISAIGLALGAALGPIVSGLISSFASWRFLFLLSLLPLLTLPLYRKYLDNEKGTASKIDILGGILLAGTVAALMLSITQGNVLLLALSIVLLLLFIIRIRTAAEPFINPKLFQNKKYSAGLVIAFLVTSLVFGLPFITPQFLTKINHLTPAMIGFVMFPAAITSALLGRKGGKLADEKGNTVLFLTATMLIFVCFMGLSSFIGYSEWIIAGCLIFGSLGQTFMQISVSNTISRTLSKDQVGVGMGLFSMLGFISGAMATSLIGKVLDFRTNDFHLNPFIKQPAAFVYSNILFFLALMMVGVAFLYWTQFGRKTRES